MATRDDILSDIVFNLIRETLYDLVSGYFQLGAHMKIIFICFTYPASQQENTAFNERTIKPNNKLP